MSEQAELNLTPLTSAVRNTMGKGKEQTSKNLDKPASDVALREYYDKYYHQLLPTIAEKVHQEKTQQEKLKEVKSRLNLKDFSKKYKDSRSIIVLRVQDSGRKRSQEEAKELPRHRPEGRRDEGVFNRLGGKKGTSSRDTKAFSKSEDSGGGHWKSRSKKAKSSIEEDELSQPWICEETDPFTPRICYFELPKKSRMPNNVKTYYGCNDLKDYLKIFQAAVKVEGWAMPTWFHMFNSTLIGSARNHQPQAHQMMHDNIPISVDEMMSVTTTFLRVEVAASNQARKKSPPAWKQWEVGRKQNFLKMGDFRNQKIQSSATNDYSCGKRNNNKFYEIHEEVGNNTDECVHLKRQIKELIKNGKLWHMIKELKQGSKKDQPKTAKKGETSGKEKPLAILMVQPLQRVARPGVRKIQAVSSTAHEMLKFSVSKGIITLFSSMIIPLECTMVSRPEAQPSDIIQAVEERIKSAIHPQHLEQTIAIGSTLTEEGRKALGGYVPGIQSEYQGNNSMSEQEFPTLTAPIEREELTVNLAPAREAIIAVLITEREAKQMQSTLLAMPYKTKKIIQGTNLSGFHNGTSERRPSRHAHGSEGGTSGPVDAVYGRIIMRRWFQSWSDTYKSRRSRIHLRPEIQV
nr:reverse transcriptase domain-containing protein [Tanacetum cinerariifolium]